MPVISPPQQISKHKQRTQMGALFFCILGISPCGEGRDCSAPGRGEELFRRPAAGATVPSYLRMIVYNYLRRVEHPDTKVDDWWVVK